QGDWLIERDQENEAMASEKAIERVLDLLTTAPQAEVESLRAGAGTHARSLRHIIDNRNTGRVGISEKITDRTPTGRLALAFYDQKEQRLSKLGATMAVAPTVPEALSGPEAIPCDVVVLGKVIPEARVTRNPVQPGYSIGHVDITAGTFGAVVSKGGEHLLL